MIPAQHGWIARVKAGDTFDYLPILSWDAHGVAAYLVLDHTRVRPLGAVLKERPLDAVFFSPGKIPTEASV